MAAAEREPLKGATVELVSAAVPCSGTLLAAPPAPAAAAEDRATDPDIAAWQGYAYSWLAVRALYAIVALLSGGLARRWLRLRIALTLRPCWLGAADVVLVTLSDGRRELAEVTALPGALHSVHISASAATSPQHLLHEDEELQPLGAAAPAAAAPKEHDAACSSSGRLLVYRCGRYVFSAAEQTFVPVRQPHKGFGGMLAHAAEAPLVAGEEGDRASREALYGPNELTIPVPSIPTLLLEEMIHPFFLFQYMSVLIWCLGGYWSYSAVIMAMTLGSIFSNVTQAWRYRRRLAHMAHYTCEVEVLGPGGRLQPRDSSALLPGDVVAVHPGPLPCDLVLLRGEAIVDESMLTGESVPVRKVSWSSSGGSGSYHPDDPGSKGCTLYGGTTVAQVRGGGGGGEGPALAMVARTGFATAKGQLFKSILHPREQHQTFVGDALRFIAAMLALGFAFFIWDAIALARYGAPAGFILYKYLDLITIAVPPALPACLSVATAIAVGRLRRQGIFTSEPSAINVAGLLDTICFDKTGTLTQPGLELRGVVPSRGADTGFAPLCEPAALPTPLCEVLATCHGLARLGSGPLAELVGDPLDQRLWAAMEAAGWQLLEDAPGGPTSQTIEVVSVTSFDEDGAVAQKGGHAGAAPAGSSPTGSVLSSPREHDGVTGVLAPAAVTTRVAPPGNHGAYSIVRRFEFSAEAQRSTVVVRRPDGTLFCACKGSPEAIRALSAPSSLPSDFETELHSHTVEGLRVLALASRPLAGLREAEALVAGREELEAELAFMGFAVMANPLRSDTVEVLGQLAEAGIRCIMVTGDHARTAVSVAHQCGMLCLNKSVAVFDGADAAGKGSTSDDEAGSSGGGTGAGATAAARVSSRGGGGGPTLIAHVAGPDGSNATAPEPSALLPGVAAGELDAAATGRGFAALRQQGGADTVLLRAGVFARMQPEDKRAVVDLLGQGAPRGGGGGLEPGQGHCVGFCGDGANDTCALRAAAVGVSLCEAEASVAAPLTSKRQSIACMLAVVAEGRASLVTSYVMFQFIISYAFVQVFGVALMYSRGNSVGNWQYVVQDLLYITVLAGLMGLTQPSRKLGPERPPQRLLSLGIWLPVAAQLLACGAFQLLALLSAVRSDGYKALDPPPDCFTVGGNNSPHCSRSADNSAVFLMSLAQFLITALVLNGGPPFRQPLWTNMPLICAMTAQTFFLLFLLLAPANGFAETVGGLVPLAPALRGRLLVLMLLNLVVSYASDAGARRLYQSLRGRRICGVTVL